MYFRPLRFIRSAGLTLLCLFVIGITTSAAQQDNDGSLFSRFGIGTMPPVISSQGIGMGHTETASLSQTYLSVSNPGSWSNQQYTRFTAGLQYSVFRASNQQGQASQLGSGMLRPVQFSFPIYRGRLGFLTAYTPYSQVGYRVVERGQLPGDLGVNAQPQDYRTVFNGNGGLQMLRSGLGYRIHRNVSVGASADVLFGTIEHNVSTSFPGGTLLERTVSQLTNISGVTATAGAVSQFPTPFLENDLFFLGATATLPAHLSGETTTILDRPVRTDTVNAATIGSISIPPKFAAGLAYYTGSQVLLAIDGRYGPWEKLSSSFRLPGFRNSGQSFSNRWHLGAGVEIQPSAPDRRSFVTYFSRMEYRLGAYIQQSHIRPQPDVKLHKYALTAGLSLPTQIAINRIDLTAEVGRYQPTTDGLFRDSFFNLSATLNFGEPWFRPQRVQ